MMVTGADIVTEARHWMGAPYKHQGRTPQGVDCVGLLIGIAHDMGLSDYDVDGYPRVPDGITMTSLLREQMKPIPIDEIRPGDVVHIAFFSHAQHLAIVTRLDPPYIIHAYSKNAQVVEHRLDETWRRRVRAAYRFPGVTT